MMYFATVCLIGLIALEVVHMVYFRSWNSEVFSAISRPDRHLHRRIHLAENVKKFF